ncbi:hypothetical protein GCM10020229_47000 [Kitasatospora albolonga]|uniref:hypothetical protein n=1 Tax=Kitasatospora albolonga TaxID=68173 RepID=UPI0031E93750
MSEAEARPVRRRVRLIGFWGTAESDHLPHPAALVDPGWDEAERHQVAGYLEDGQIAAEWMGVSRCRLCDRPNGSRDLTDGVYLWPEGLAHYVVEHAVRLPAEFVEHVEVSLQALEDLERDSSWWRENAART